jgi:hypothetical protein
MKYVKKPIVVEAFQFGVDYMPDWFVDKMSTNEIVTQGTHPLANDMKRCEIKTLEGVMKASKGDMIIKGIKGEIYPCKKDIFDATYDVYDEELESTVL